MPKSDHWPERVLVAAAVVLTCVLFTRQALDPVNVIKLTALLFAALALLALSLSRLVRRRVANVPLSPAGAAGVVLAVALVLAAAAAPVTTTAVVGTYGRNSGLLAYLAGLVLFFTGLRFLDRRGAPVLLAGVVIAGLFTATYGLLQKADLDAVPWNNPFNPIIAALGNPNFASGYLGIAGSVSLGGALYAGWARGWRITAGITAGLCLLVASLSASVQGPIAAAAGVFVLLIALALDLNSNMRRVALSGLAGVALASVASLAVGGLAKAGPAARLFSDIGSEARTHYWRAAIEMFRDEPVLGVGLDHYGAFWRTARTPESVEALGGGQYSDAAHSVPLQMLAQGGLVLGLAYAIFIVITFIALIRGLLALRGPDRMLLAALGAGWGAYQVQSAVSIDQVPLLVLHFALAGGVVAVAGAAGLRELRLPGAPTPVVAHRNDARTRRRIAAAPAPRSRPLTGTDLLLLSGLALLILVAAWQALHPMRANLAVREGDRLRSLGDGTGAFTAYDRATDLLSGQSFYWTKKGQLFQQATPPQLSQAQAAYVEAVEQDPYDVNAALAGATVAEAAGDLAVSRKLFTYAVEHDPLNPDTVVAAATFELRHSGAREARELMEATVVHVRGSAALWAALGDARAVLKDPAGARQAYERALTLDPASQTALDGMVKLAA